MTRSRPEVTIVIPCYEALRTIERAAVSALQQNAGNVCLILVIDDGCEQTRDRIEALGDERIRILMNASNLGAPASRNRGLEAVQSDYVMFLDADDYLRGDFVGALVTEMEREQASVGFGPQVICRGSQRYSRRKIPDYASPTDFIERWLGEKDTVNSSGTLWRTSSIRSIGAWDPAILRNQDGELAARAVLLGLDFCQSSVGEAIYVQHDGRHRITASSANLGALIDVVQKLLGLQSNVVERTILERACARNLYHSAVTAFYRQDICVGRRALALSREMGFRGHLGSRLHRLLSRLLGLEQKQRLAGAIKSQMSRFANGSRKEGRRR